MGCNCKKNNAETGEIKPHEAVSDGWVYKQTREEKIKPTEQCIACAQKHFDEAWIAFNECGYEDANRRFVRGSLRAVVLHTFREWKEIGRLARECALLVQSAEDDKAVSKMELLGGMIDKEFYKANPEALQRLNTLKERANEQHPTADSASGDGKPD